MLNQLQNSDIGCYEHFEFDYNFYAVLQVDAYLEMENYRKIQEIEEEKAIKSGELVPKETKGKSRPFRKRFEFDETGLTEEQINEK